MCFHILIYFCNWQISKADDKYGRQKYDIFFFPK